MFDSIKQLQRQYELLCARMEEPSTYSDPAAYSKYEREARELQPIVNAYTKYQQADSRMQEALELMGDSEMRELAQEEYSQAKADKERLEQEIKILLLPKDPNDDKNVIMEIRAGAGGDEAGLFGYELYRMYVRYAERHRFRTEEIENNSTELGGIKEVVFSISGKGAYSKLKYESGVHRVQRVPETESQGRVHTSTVTVAVLPEVEDVEVNIDEKDLKIDLFRSGGAGGQHVNKTESCIRITHLPTGIVVVCQDERSQTKNREKAMKVLKSRLYDHYQSAYEKEYSENRRSQVGTGDRSERIRTYNFPQGRVTDHRIGLTLYSLDSFLMGDMDEMVDALAIADREAKLTQNAEEM